MTNITSLGMWIPVYDEEWDGDVPLGLTRVLGSQRDADEGTVTFKANTLPWLVGRYEVNFFSIQYISHSWLNFFRFGTTMMASTMS